jgi:hypothetical protein
MQGLSPHLRRSDMPARLSILDGFQTGHWSEVALQFDPELGAIPKQRRSSLYDPEDSLPRSSRLGTEN